MSRLINNIWNFLVLKRKKVQIGKRLTIHGKIYVHGKKQGIIIGNDCTIISSSNINPTSGFNHTHLRTENNGIILIHNHVGISHANITSFSKVTIDDDVLIGSGVKIWDTDFHSIQFNSRFAKSNCDVKTSPIHICQGAFIGACSIILKGVTIGEKSIIGAGSVVTKNVPSFEIWAGNPAKFIKKIDN